MAAQLFSSALPEIRAQQLQVQFQSIHSERMSNVSVINDNIDVEAVGFREWQGHILGVLVTPWFMNLMLLPGMDENWSDYRPGTKQSFLFNAGSFEFVVGKEDNIGLFMSCSMFSPMFEFDSHQAAVVTAKALIEGLFDDENAEKLGSHELRKEEADKDDGGVVLDYIQAIADVTHRNMDQPTSRRDMLRGSFLRAQSRQAED
jgi:[NiFe] hydrogenase assembly HybE family chaperone